MAEGLILEFDGVGREDYDAVNALVGIDTTRRNADWPEGLVFHAGGAKPGGWVVFEVWESRELQGQFLEGRLGAALAGGGVGQPARVEWLDLAAYTAIGG